MSTTVQEGAAIYPDFVDKNINYCCTRCLRDLLDPLQLICGHRMCRTCLEFLKQKLKPFDRISCPVKNENCADSLLNEVFPDKSAERDIKKRLVYCPFKSQGCGQKFPFSELSKHMKECQYDSISCPYRCNFFSLRYELEEHIKICPNVLHCKFSHIGCGSVFQSRDELSAHESDVSCHLDSFQEKYKKLKSERDFLERCIEKQNELEPYLHEFNKVKDDYEHLLRVIKLLEKKITELEKQSEDLDHVLKTSDAYKADLGVFGSGTSSLVIQEDTRNKLIEHDKAIGQHDIRLIKLVARLECLENTDYGGTLFWKITDYQTKKHNAVSGGSQSLYSPPFFTQRYGYKMCSRVYLNGDGVGKGTHLSLFFVIMKGDYDNVLSWPFSQKVTFMLVDQKGSKRDIVYTFQSDSKSVSFQKPTSPVNLASGCPLFVPHTTLENPTGMYLRNNTIFLQIKVG